MCTIERTDAEVGFRIAIEQRATAQSQTVRRGGFQPRERVTCSELIPLRKALVEFERQGSITREAVGRDDGDRVVRRVPIAQDDRGTVTREEIRSIQVAHELVHSAAV